MGARTMRRRVCLVAFGSIGDVHPMLSLGADLRSRGHAVSLLTSPFFAAQATAAGLDFEPVGDEKDALETAQHPKLWHPIDGLGVMWRYLLRPALEPTYRRLAQLSAIEPCVCIASPVAMGARVAQEHLHLPLITVYTAATMLRTVRDPMTLAHLVMPRWAPTPLRHLAWALLDRYKLEPLVRPALDALRNSLGLPRLTKPVFGEWMHSPQAGVALFPSWFAAAAPDWPAQVVQAGFPLYDGDAAGSLSPALQQFLSAGSPPVVFMPGTAQQQAPRFFEAATRACAETGYRGLLLGPMATSLSKAVPQAIHCEDYAPFSVLLPRVRGLVHHGGVGTSAQALRAAVPQLLQPQAYDQFDNTLRLEQLGVGLRLSQEPDGRMMAMQLRRLLDDPAIASACSRVAAKVTPHEAHETVSRLVEAVS
jgi:rhamnosyltransferase subunit B